MSFDLDQAIVDLVTRDAVKIPPYPAVAMKLSELTRREDYGLDEVTKLVASDQALAADVLRTANSAFYRRGAEVTSLQQAVSRIGAKDLVRLALASGIGAHAMAAGPLSGLRRRAWLASLASAALCQELAKKRKLAPEEAFVCGLLHDFGEVIALAAVEQLVSQAPGFEARPLEFWEDVLDRYHVELGLVMAARWKLPQLVSDVISVHHTESFAGAEVPGMVELVSASDEIVRLLDARARVSREDLQAVATLDTAELDVVPGILERLPPFVASFEAGAGPARPPERSLVAPPPDEAKPTWSSGPSKPGFRVIATVAGRKVAYEAVGIASNAVMVSGTEPLAENLLLEMTLQCQPPLTCFGVAKLSWKEGERLMVLLQPYSLGGPAEARWKELVARSTPA